MCNLWIINCDFVSMKYMTGANLQAITHIMHSIISKPSYNEPDQKNSTLAIKRQPRKSSDEKNLTLTSRHQPTINSKRPRGYVCFRTIDKDVWVCVCAREKCKQSNDAYVLYAMLMWMYHLSELSDSSRKAWNHNITFAASGPTIALHTHGTVLHVCVCAPTNTRFKPSYNEPWRRDQP